VRSAYKETIFGIFKRLHTSSKYSGSGMRLSICRRALSDTRDVFGSSQSQSTGPTFSLRSELSERPFPMLTADSRPSQSDHRS
jgi:light-regulated signal transduction histidine kinase (bacteriophytochrome)